MRRAAVLGVVSLALVISGCGKDEPSDYNAEVEKNFIEHRQVAWYADKLHITPKHLADVVKQTIARTPRQVIADMLMLEAKVLLGSTDLTISQIAQQLYFDDQAHFAHFIKQRSGQSPTELRTKL